MYIGTEILLSANKLCCISFPSFFLIFYILLRSEDETKKRVSVEKISYWHLKTRNKYTSFRKRGANELAIVVIIDMLWKCKILIKYW